MLPKILLASSKILELECYSGRLEVWLAGRKNDGDSRHRILVCMPFSSHGQSSFSPPST